MQVLHHQATGLNHTRFPSVTVQRFDLKDVSALSAGDKDACAWSADSLSRWVAEVDQAVRQHITLPEWRLHLLPVTPPPEWIPDPKPKWITADAHETEVWMAIPPEPDELHFKSVLAHELHHLGQDTTRRGSSLGFRLAAEGLAEAFSYSLFPSHRWFRDSMSPEVEHRYTISVKPLLRSSEFFDVMLYLNGDPDSGVPHFAGYTFGYRAVERFRSEHPVKSWSDLWRVHTWRLLGFSGRS